MTTEINPYSVFPPAGRRGTTHVSTCVCSKPTQRRAREEAVIRVIRMQAMPRDIPSTENDAGAGAWRSRRRGKDFW